MAVLRVIKLGHPTLRKRALEVSDAEFNDELNVLAKNLIDTMKAYEGIGLAAPQVNIGKRIFVIDVGAATGEEDALPEAFINPKILVAEGSETLEEGCLSIPGVQAEVTRPFKIKAEYRTLDGETVEEEMEGLLARVFQHEFDHLEGVLFIDRISFLQRKLLEPKLKQIREENSLA